MHIPTFLKFMKNMVLTCGKPIFFCRDDKISNNEIGEAMITTRHSVIRKACAAVICLQLCVSSAVTGSISVEAQCNAVSITIQEMLEKGAYREGEAIALIQGSESFSLSGEVLTNVDPHTVLSTIDEALSSDLTARTASQRMGDSEKESLQIQYIQDSSLTTEELLKRLYSNPRVIAAEPNYIVTRTDGVRKTDQAVQPVASVGQEETTDSGDLTALQWSLNESSEHYTTPLSPTSGYQLHVPGWQEGHVNETAEPNASGTVCIMDTGIDVTHPDLKNVLYEFSKAQQETYECGPYGKNTSGTEDTTDMTDHGSHGTHVSGIIAAQWNHSGVSGIANGVKIFGVRIFGDDGMTSDEACCIKGFTFLRDIAQEVNLKAVNCSWGYLKPQLINNILINELGRKGVSTVFASGNTSMDLDEQMDSGASITSPYAIVANGASMDGKIADYSCWGQTSTDVFAPGSSVISTVPSIIQNKTFDGSISYYREYQMFYPDASDSSSLLYGIDRFDGASEVRFFAENPALNPDAKEIGQRSETIGFDDHVSMEFDLKDLNAGTNTLNDGAEASGGSMYMAIPVASAANVKYIFAECAVDHYKQQGGFVSVTYANTDGKPVEIDNKVASALNKGWIGTSNSTFYVCQWSPLSFNVEGYLNTVNEVHQMSQSEREENGLWNYEDPGKVTGLYAWENQGKTYVIAEIGLGSPDPSASVNPSKLYVDQIAVGNGEAWTGPYLVMSGTSMAAPAVTACLSVIAKNEPELSSLSEKELSQLTLERNAKLLASVEYDDTLKQYCRTGGRVNLSRNDGFVRKAPIIEFADEADSVLTITGYFFGTEGSLRIDGRPWEPIGWDDHTVTADVSKLGNGSHVAELTNPDNAVSQVVFSVSSSETGLAPLYEKELVTPVHHETYIKNSSDRLFGQMVEYDRHLYVFNINITERINALWSYDIDQDSWEYCAELPDSINGSMLAGMTVYDEKLYVSVSPENTDAPSLWTYDSKTDTWADSDLPLPKSAALCVLENKLIAIAGIHEFENDEYEPSDFSVYNPETKTCTDLKCTLPPDGMDTSRLRVAVTDGSVYIYGPDVGVEGNPHPDGMLYRLTWNEDKTDLILEDLNDAFEDLSVQHMNEQIALAGLPDGVAIIGSGLHGQDTHVIYDDSDWAIPYDHTLSYHFTYTPTAAYADGWIYALGYSTTEKDLMFFRATDVNHRFKPVTDLRKLRKSKESKNEKIRTK